MNYSRCISEGLKASGLFCWSSWASGSCNCSSSIPAMEVSRAEELNNVEVSRLGFYACLLDMEMGFMEEEEEDAQAANTCAQSESQLNSASTNFNPTLEYPSHGIQCQEFFYIVDIDFKAQFEMARPTREFNSLVQLLPNIFVGKPERMQMIINLMCNALNLCLNK
eukprot:Gb_27906 [translate_table: standard]